MEKIIYCIIVYTQEQLRENKKIKNKQRNVLTYINILNIWKQHLKELTEESESNEEEWKKVIL